MTRRLLLSLPVVLLPVLLHAQTVAPVPLPQRPDGRTCLHGENESAAEAARRIEALAAMRLIDYVVEARAPLTGFPEWEELSTSPVVASLQGGGGPGGALARKLAWGSPQPLPGWGIAYVATRTDVRFSLTDLRDPCGFTYTSMDPEVITRRRMRIVPLS